MHDQFAATLHDHVLIPKCPARMGHSLPTCMCMSRCVCSVHAHGSLLHYKARFDMCTCAVWGVRWTCAMAGLQAVPPGMSREAYKQCCSDAHWASVTLTDVDCNTGLPFKLLLSFDGDGPYCSPHWSMRQMASRHPCTTACKPGGNGIAQLEKHVIAVKACLVNIAYTLAVGHTDRSLCSNVPHQADMHQHQNSIGQPCCQVIPAKGFAYLSGA